MGPLLRAGDPAPVSVVNPGGASPFLLIGDHAGNVIPEALGTLGLPAAERARHIAWDIGIAGLGEAMARDMDAVFVRQSYSRLVVDCNRRPDDAGTNGAPGAIAPTSDGSPVPGNRDLSRADRQARIDEIHEPYQQAIAAEIAHRRAAGRETVLIALHSFTPALKDGRARPWHVGVLHHLGEPAFARALIAALARDVSGDGSLTVGDNEPYRMDLIDYTVPRHAWPAGLAYAEIEVRQDLIGDAGGQAAWAARLKVALEAARENIGTAGA
ncbi:N-formylglutamate amidohydrolase [Sphingomonas bacterium]|uniref:N-formylglutamate amidohydrolase n=1 Tax=Sphingomonas bacterium TaxID=1895847 RepID=UPI001C2DE6D0|nr:N-formylglutamate amidohydrolase [Sphingomonas bacterium]